MRTGRERWLWKSSGRGKRCIRINPACMKCRGGLWLIITVREKQWHSQTVQCLADCTLKCLGMTMWQCITDEWFLILKLILPAISITMQATTKFINIYILFTKIGSTNTNFQYNLSQLKITDINYYYLGHFAQKSNFKYNYHYYYTCLMASFPGQPGYADCRYQKGKSTLDLNKPRDNKVLGCSSISWTICKQSAPRSRQTTTPTTRHSIFTGRMLFLTSNQSTEF